MPVLAATCLIFLLASPVLGRAQTASAGEQLQRLGIAISPEQLVQYAALGDLATVNLLIDAGLSVNRAEPTRQVTALHNAAAQGHERMVRRLLEAGAEVNVRDWHGITPLMAAEYAGHAAIVRRLLAHGAISHPLPVSEAIVPVEPIRHGKPVLLKPLPVAAAAGGATVLDYRAMLLNLPVDAKPVVPESVFHGWELADAQGRKIIDAWQREPVTLPWTRVQLERHVRHKIMPTRGARGLALMHVAMHDAYQLAIVRGCDPALVVSMAAAQVLGYLYSAEEKAFERIVFTIAALMHGTSPDQPGPLARQALVLGKAVGAHVVHHGETDGAQKGWNGIRLQWHGEGRYYGPGAWEPTPPYFYYPPDEPFAPTWRTWALEHAGQFRPTPPAFGSPHYMRDLQEVVQISRTLQPAQRDIARFWVDGHGSVTPPGHWNQIAIEEVTREKLDSLVTARLFAHLNMAQADTFIAVWDTKYHYWTARPITVARTLLGVELKPALLTPPFPSYVSGHAAFSGAAARILQRYFPAQGARLEAMAMQAAHSRLLGGIHFRHDNEDGLLLGQQVADQVLNRHALAP